MHQTTSETDKVTSPHRSIRDMAASVSGDMALKAYFGTTQGVLSGRPNDPALLEVRKELDDHHICYLFNPIPSRPRPIFSGQGWTSVGIAEIRQHIAVIERKL